MTNTYDDNLMESKKIVRLGIKKVMKNGLVAEVINYNGCKHVDIRFEDGYIAKDREYADFEKGNVSNPNKPNKVLPNPNMKDKIIGEEKIACNGLRMTIVDYVWSNDLTVRFEDGTIEYHKRHELFEKGNIRHPSLSPVNKSKFAGFVCKRIKDFTGYFYKCECQKCKEIFLMTPQMMLKHQKECI